MPSFPQRTGAGFTASVTFDPASVTNGTTAEQDVTVAGILPGYHYHVQAPDLEAGVIITGARCVTKGTLKIRFGNITAAPINPASQTFIVRGI